MSTLARRFIVISLGVIAGVGAWPLTELVLFFQAEFPSYLVFLSLLGAIVGAVMAAFFGAAEGITSRIKARIPNGMYLGALIGLVGGAAGALAGQAALWLIGGLFIRSYGNFRLVVLPISRAIGWAVLGVFVGVVEGIRAFSPKKIAVGVLGGLVGGLVGGFALEYSRILLPCLFFSRLIGLVVLGLSITLFYSLIEQGMAFGVLRILTGELKGKEFLINQGRMRIGRSPSAEVSLPSYKDLADFQAQIRVRKGEAVLSNLEPKLGVLVNEQGLTEERKMKLGDVIQIGSAKIFYKYE
jgi:hypothetical protein